MLEAIQGQDSSFHEIIFSSFFKISKLFINIKPATKPVMIHSQYLTIDSMMLAASDDICGLCLSLGPSPDKVRPHPSGKLNV